MRRKSITLSTCLFLTRTAFASPYLKLRNILHDEGSAEPGLTEKLVISFGLVLAGGVFAGYVKLLLFVFRLSMSWLDLQAYSWFDGFGWTSPTCLSDLFWRWEGEKGCSERCGLYLSLAYVGSQSSIYWQRVFSSQFIGEGQALGSCGLWHITLRAVTFLRNILNRYSYSEMWFVLPNPGVDILADFD